MIRNCLAEKIINFSLLSMQCFHKLTEFFNHDLSDGGLVDDACNAIEFVYIITV